MRPDDAQTNETDIPPYDASEHNVRQEDEADETVESSGGGSQLIAEFEDHVQLVRLENGDIIFIGSEEQFSFRNQSGIAYYWVHDTLGTIAAVPQNIVSAEGNRVRYTAEFIPIVVGSGDGSSFAIIDYSSFVEIQEGMPHRASLDDGTLVYGIVGKKIGDLHGKELYQFDILPILIPFPSGGNLVRGPAEKIIENELVNAFTHDARPLVVIPRERVIKAKDGTVIHRADMEVYNNDLAKFRDQAERFAHANNTFVFFYNGPINDRGFDKLVRACVEALGRTPRTRERTRVLLILVTQGGDPHAAYKCARYLWHHFRGYQILIPGWCKSAGTLLAMGADEIYISEFGELGPIDLQVYEKDADFIDSSATLIAALEAIRENSYQTFDHYMSELGSHPSMTLQTRSEISTRLTNEIHASISGKIDPRELGKMHRHLKLCYEYGIRLATRARNINEEGVRRLVYDYPQHGFVIDRYEAADLFPNVISEELEGFVDILNLISPLSWRLRSPYSEERQIIETIATPRRPA